MPKIQVRFKKALYPYQEWDVWLLNEDFARGQFADFVEILDDKKPETKIFEAPENKTMFGKSKKTKSK